MTLLQIEHARKRNLYSFQPFILGYVMFWLGFNVRFFNPKNPNTTPKMLTSQIGQKYKELRQAGETLNSIKTTETDVTKLHSAEETYKNTNARIQKEIENILSTNSKDYFTTDATCGSPVVIDDNVEYLRAFFVNISETFSNWQPGTKTPLEIVQEVLRTTFLEFFERQDGQIHFRQPRYNATKRSFPLPLVRDRDFLSSSYFDVNSTTYPRTLKGLLSRQRVSFEMDCGVTLPEGFNIFTSGSGKILAQYGLRDSDTPSNPNMRFIESNDPNVQAGKVDGLFALADFMLTLNNYNQRAGTIVISGMWGQILEEENATIQPKIGNTFFDELEQKFGYVVETHINHQVGRSYTTTLTLSYVRDALFSADVERGEIQLNFLILPVLTHFANRFQTKDFHLSVEAATKFTNQISPLAIVPMKTKYTTLLLSWEEEQRLVRAIILDQKVATVATKQVKA
jgi:hypothetical protein